LSAITPVAERAETTDLAAPAVEQSRSRLEEAMLRAGSPPRPSCPRQRTIAASISTSSAGTRSCSRRIPSRSSSPTRDKLHLLQECIELLEETVDWCHVKLVIVDDHSPRRRHHPLLAQIVQRTI
jgi:hypothetical protein